MLKRRSSAIHVPPSPGGQLQDVLQEKYDSTGMSDATTSRFSQNFLPPSAAGADNVVSCSSMDVTPWIRALSGAVFGWTAMENEYRNWRLQQGNWMLQIYLLLELAQNILFGGRLLLAVTTANDQVFPALLLALVTRLVFLISTIAQLVAPRHLKFIRAYLVIACDFFSLLLLAAGCFLPLGLIQSHQAALEVQLGSKPPGWMMWYMLIKAVMMQLPPPWLFLNMGILLCMTLVHAYTFSTDSLSQDEQTSPKPATISRQLYACTLAAVVLSIWFDAVHRAQYLELNYDAAEDLQQQRGLICSADSTATCDDILQQSHSCPPSPTHSEHQTCVASISNASSTSQALLDSASSSFCTVSSTQHAFEEASSSRGPPPLPAISALPANPTTFTPTSSHQSGIRPSEPHSTTLRAVSSLAAAVGLAAAAESSMSSYGVLYQSPLKHVIVSGKVHSDLQVQEIRSQVDAGVETILTARGLNNTVTTSVWYSGCWRFVYHVAVWPSEGLASHPMVSGGMKAPPPEHVALAGPAATPSPQDLQCCDTGNAPGCPAAASCTLSDPQLTSLDMCNVPDSPTCERNLADDRAAASIMSMPQQAASPPPPSPNGICPPDAPCDSNVTFLNIVFKDQGCGSQSSSRSGLGHHHSDAPSSSSCSTGEPSSDVAGGRDTPHAPGTPTQSDRSEFLRVDSGKAAIMGPSTLAHGSHTPCSHFITHSMTNFVPTNKSVHEGCVEGASDVAGPSACTTQHAMSCGGSSTGESITAKHSILDADDAGGTSDGSTTTVDSDKAGGLSDGSTIDVDANDLSGKCSSNMVDAGEVGGTTNSITVDADEAGGTSNSNTGNADEAGGTSNSNTANADEAGGTSNSNTATSVNLAACIQGMLPPNASVSDIHVSAGPLGLVRPVVPHPVAVMIPQQDRMDEMDASEHRLYSLRNLILRLPSECIDEFPAIRVIVSLPNTVAPMHEQTWTKAQLQDLPADEDGGSQLLLTGLASMEFAHLDLPPGASSLVVSVLGQEQPAPFSTAHEPQLGVAHAGSVHRMDRLLSTVLVLMLPNRSTCSEMAALFKHMVAERRGSFRAAYAQHFYPFAWDLANALSPATTNLYIDLVGVHEYALLLQHLLIYLQSQQLPHCCDLLLQRLEWECPPQLAEEVTAGLARFAGMRSSLADSPPMSPASSPQLLPDSDHTPTSGSHGAFEIQSEQSHSKSAASTMDSSSRPDKDCGASAWSDTTDSVSTKESHDNQTDSGSTPGSRKRHVAGKVEAAGVIAAAHASRPRLLLSFSCCVKGIIFGWDQCGAGPEVMPDLKRYHRIQNYLQQQYSPCAFQIFELVQNVVMCRKLWIAAWWAAQPPAILALYLVAAQRVLLTLSACAHLSGSLRVTRYRGECIVLVDVLLLILVGAMAFCPGGLQNAVLQTVQVQMAVCRVTVLSWYVFVRICSLQLPSPWMLIDAGVWGGLCALLVGATDHVSDVKGIWWWMSSPWGLVVFTAAGVLVTAYFQVTRMMCCLGIRVTLW